MLRIHMNWFEQKIAPMLAVKGKPFSNDKYIYEIKWDGTRCIAFVDVENKRLRMQNRRFHEISYRYPELDFFDFLNESAIIDGEIVVLKDGKPSFYHLQEREHTDSKLRINVLSKRLPATYFAYDVLYTQSNGWIMNLPLIERRRILEEISANTNRILISDYIRGRGEEFYKRAVELGLEGIMAKKAESTYKPGRRSREWIKLKKAQTADCVIVGWMEGEGGRENSFGSLVLALKDGERFKYVGRVGTGFDFRFLESFIEKLKAIETDKPVIEEREFPRRVHWVKPKYVCEVEFLEFTNSGKLRAPVFLRLREDKSVEECTYDQ